MQNINKEIIKEKFRQTFQQFYKDLKRCPFSEFISEVYLYGSFAEGRATAKSDIDICIILKEIPDTSILRNFRTACDYPDLLEIDIHFKSKDDFLINNIYNNNVKKGVQIWNK